MSPLPPGASEVIDAFRVSESRLRSVVEAFKQEVEKGLSKDGMMIKCLPSFVNSLPPADLQETSLALDLGGTNFRVCSVVMDRGNVNLDQEKFQIPPSAKETSDAMFDFLAGCVKTYVDKRNLVEKRQNELNLGFTFSFPVQQHSLASGSLIMWTKGFTTPGVVGEDVVALLARACSKLGLRVKVNALVNDTVGTLMSHAVTDTNTRIGMIVGTGSNAAYVEKRAKVTKMGPPKPDEHELMVINLECGNFGSNTDYLPLTEYDRKTIGESTAPDEQWLEKMISGMYLGEIARQAILDLYGKGLVFGGEKLPAQLENRHGLDTEVMSRALAIPADQATAFLQKELGADISDADAAVLLPLFDVVGERSARLCGASVAALVEHMSEACTAAVDGSVFEHYPHFRANMKKAVVELLGPDLGSKVKIELGKDGSGVGAGVIAALA